MGERLLRSEETPKQRRWSVWRQMENRGKCIVKAGGSLGDHRLGLTLPVRIWVQAAWCRVHWLSEGRAHLRNRTQPLLGGSCPWQTWGVAFCPLHTPRGGAVIACILQRKKWKQKFLPKVLSKHWQSRL